MADAFSRRIPCRHFKFAITVHLPVPQVFVLAHPGAQVFSYARTRKQTRVFISSGALALFSPLELEAVLTFQMMAMSRSVTIINYWVGAVLDLFFRSGRTLERGFALIFGWSPPLASWMIRPVMWTLQGLLLSARDFERLDKDTAAALTTSRRIHCSFLRGLASTGTSRATRRNRSEVGSVSSLERRHMSGSRTRM